MELLFTKSKWEITEAPLTDYLDRLKADGYDGAELYLPGEPSPTQTIRQEILARDLVLVAQTSSNGSTPAEHLESLKPALAQAAETEPLFVNSHTGNDLFSFSENLKIFEAAHAVAKEFGLILTHEIHRGKALCSGPISRSFLEANPDILLTADFSHWMCTHESDLSNQPENVAAAIKRSFHIHARVGFEEGPQVDNPHSPTWQRIVDRHFDLWQGIVDNRKAQGAKFLTITPEFGPEPYMPVCSKTGKPLADAWTVNKEFLPTLKQRLKA